MNLRIAIMRWFPVAAAIVAMLPSHAIAGETVVNEEYGFTLKLPHGFTENPDLVGAAPNIVQGFVLGDPTDDVMDIVLLIEDMGGVIGRERLKPEDMPPGFPGRLFITQWQGLEVDALTVLEQIGEIKTITYNVQIPLKRSAIQVKLFGPIDRDAELTMLLAETLGGLRGESNWIRSAAPSTALTTSQNYSYVLLAFATVFIIGGLVALLLIGRRTPRGTILAIAAVLYAVGWASAGIRVREILLLSSSLQMLGFGGIVLGIVGLLRKRTTPDQHAP